MFKRIFTKNPEILKRFLISVLKLDMNPDTATIEIESNELVKAKDKEYHKTVDILAKINNNLRIDIEINSERYDSVKFRNTMYLEKMLNLLIENVLFAINYINHTILGLHIVAEYVRVSLDKIELNVRVNYVERNLRE